MGLLFLIMIPASDHGVHSNSWGPVPSVLYIAFSRPLWSFCLAVITILCYYDYCPIWNGIMSHSAWNPFVRLTYGAYITHPMVIKLVAGNAVQYYTFSGMDMVYRIVGNSVCAYLLSLGLWCFIERPMTTLTTAMMKKQPRTSQKLKGGDVKEGKETVPMGTDDELQPAEKKAADVKLS